MEAGMASDPRLGPFGRLGERPIGERTRYRFPLTDMERYKGRITFSAEKEEVSSAAQGVIDAVAGNGNLNNINNAIDAAGAQNIAAIGGFDPSLQTVVTGRTDIEPQGSVMLFLPQSLQFNDAVAYTDIDLNIIGSAVFEGVRNRENLAGLAARGFNAAFPDFDSLQEAVTRGLTGPAAQVAAIRASRRISSEAAGAISTATGIAMNPNKRSIFESVPIRKFQFTFKLIPATASEAEAIKSIVKWFRSNMYPEKIGEGGIAFSYPSKFNISLTYGGKQVATGILPCFLESINVAYNAGSMGFHSDGNFQETDVTLAFREERALTKEDIEKGIA